MHLCALLLWLVGNYWPPDSRATASRCVLAAKADSEASSRHVPHQLGAVPAGTSAKTVTTFVLSWRLLHGAKPAIACCCDRAPQLIQLAGLFIFDPAPTLCKIPCFCCVLQNAASAGQAIISAQVDAVRDGGSVLSIRLADLVKLRSLDLQFKLDAAVRPATCLLAIDCSPHTVSHDCQMGWTSCRRRDECHSMTSLRRLQPSAPRVLRLRPTAASGGDPPGTQGLNERCQFQLALCHNL